MTSLYRQKGAALMVALMILTIVSILGVVAMRTSMFNSKITTTAQVATITFDGAESALSAVYNEAVYKPQTDPSSIIFQLVNGYQDGVSAVIDRCVGKGVGELFMQRSCTAADRADSRNLLRAGSRTVMKGFSSAPYLSSISSSGGSTINFVWYEFMSIGKGEVDVFNAEQINEQHFAKIGIAF